MALLGQALGDSGLARWGQLLTAIEIAGAQTYWQVRNLVLVKGHGFSALLATTRTRGPRRKPLLACSLCRTTARRTSAAVTDIHDPPPAPVPTPTQMPSSTPVYPQPFAGCKTVGILWGSKMDYSTWWVQECSCGVATEGHCRANPRIGISSGFGA